MRKLAYPLAIAALLTPTACQSPSQTADDSTSKAAIAGAANDDLPGAGITIRPANSDWIEERFTTEIVNIGLEALGYEIEDIQQADYAALYVALANGDLDYTTGFYNVGFDDAFENAGGDVKLEKLGQLVPDGGLQGVMIDKQTADEYQISSVEQLQDPEVAALFDSDGDGKANLAGCQTGWSCNTVIEHHLEAYDLQDTVEQDQGAYAALLADVLTRQGQGDPVLFYAYSPHWVLTELKPEEDAVWLTVPFTSLPEDFDQTEAETTVDGQNLGFPVAKQTLLASQTFVDQNPAAVRWLELVEIPAADLNAESQRIQAGENAPEDIRRHAEAWVEENRDRFEDWLGQARSAD
ncbi:MAG: glycine betaine/L-proline ABC transporter substrate-binding protein ProX [Elainellaceae cyanobacterium]